MLKPNLFGSPALILILSSWSEKSLSMKAAHYTKRLVSFDSTSRLSNRKISKYLEQKLIKHGFVVESLEHDDRRGERKVSLVAKKGSGEGGVAYFAHSDVVPANSWFTDRFGPFEPTIENERLYGRGACDMKGSIACMLTAQQSVPLNQMTRPLYFVVTADEEVGFNGAKQVVEESKFYREIVENGTKAIVGEPTMMEVVHAHKGSLEIRATSKGVAAHSSTRDGINSTLPMIPFMAEMKKIYDEIESESKWKNELFDPAPMGWNITVGDDSPAMNITPSKTVCTVYARPVPGADVGPLLARAERAAEENGVKLKVKRWCEPFYCAPDSEFVRQALQLVGRSAPKTVSFATDGGILSEITDKIVVGPGDIAQAHTPEEWISLEQLERGTELYADLIRYWCGDKKTDN